jgi:hypothetical protein
MEPNMLPKFCPHEIWDKRNNTSLYIPFPNGSVIFFKGADNPDSLRGPNPRGVVLDEYGTMKPEVWSAVVQPIMMANPDSWCWFIGTPKGRNHFFTRWNQADGQESWQRDLLRASESGIIDPASLYEAKRTTAEDYYQQEYECSFLEGAGSAFKKIRENVWLPPEELPAGDYQIGVDLENTMTGR